MKTRTFIGMAVMLMALAGMTACSNDDNPVDNPIVNPVDNPEDNPEEYNPSDENDSTEPANPTEEEKGNEEQTTYTEVRGGVVYDGWGKPDVDTSDPLAVFFRDELHGPYWDGSGNKYMTFFDHGEWNDEICLMINSQQEFKTAYMGTKELPDVDFNQYTLIIGKTWGNDSSFELDKTVLWNLGLTYELETILLHHIDWGAFQAIMQIYYWRLYPKLVQKDIVPKRTVTDVRD